MVADEISDRYKLQPVGHAREIHQRFFAISVERKIRHPAVAASYESARRRIFRVRRAARRVCDRTSVERARKSARTKAGSLVGLHDAGMFVRRGPPPH